MAQIEIGFIGYESEDIVIYIARLLTAAGKKVVVIDYTEQMTLLRMTSLPDALLGKTGYYKDILIANDDTVSEKDKSEQDIVIHNFGYRLNHENLKSCTHVVYSTNMAVYNAQLLKEVELEEEGVSTYLMIKNYASFKYDEKYLSGVIGRKFSVDHTMLIPYDDMDYKSSCYMCVDKKHRLSKLSNPMTTALLQLFTSISDKEYKRKELATLLKRA